MDTVACGELGVNRAALQYGVMRTTLKDRLSGRVKHGTKPGPVVYLDLKEEEQLVKFLLNISGVVTGRRREVMYIVEQAAR